MRMTGLMLAVVIGASGVAMAEDTKAPAPPAPSSGEKATCAHTATIYGAKARCWRTQKHLERAEKLGMKIEYHDVDADPEANKFAMANKDHLKKSKEGEIQLPLLLIDGKIVEPEVATLSAACGVKK